MFWGLWSLHHISILLQLPFVAVLHPLHLLQGGSPLTFVLNFKSLGVLIGGLAL